jgi:bifunctional DNA-binding transcriptional regulator/antitoxin component of YhaV-PrlF toxin-antitoxin module
MCDDQGHHGSRRPTEIDCLVIVGAENGLTIPEPFAERFGIEAGRPLIFVDSGSDEEFTVRVVRATYAGALTSVFGTTEENVAYVREERASWDAFDIKKDLIAETQEIFRLSQTEIAAIVGVSESMIASWRASGIPKSQLTNVELLHDLALLFRKEFKLLRPESDWNVHARFSFLMASNFVPRFGPEYSFVMNL